MAAQKGISVRCPFHVSVEMRVTERKFKTKARSGDGAQVSEPCRFIAACPVVGCNRVAHVYRDYRVKLSAHNRVAIGVSDTERLRRGGWVNE